MAEKVGAPRCEAEFTITCEDCGVHQAAGEPCAVYRCSSAPHEGNEHVALCDGYTIAWIGDRDG